MFSVLYLSRIGKAGNRVELIISFQVLIGTIPTRYGGYLVVLAIEAAGGAGDKDRAFRLIDNQDVFVSIL